MIPLHLPGQVQDMDRRAFARGVDPAALMDHAAFLLARAVRDLARDRGLRRNGLRVVLLCGKGNNGADGIAAARHLRRSGVDALPILLEHEDALSPDARREVAGLRRVGGRVVFADAVPSGEDPRAAEPEMDGPGTRARLSALVDRADLVVDCLLGTGATGPPRGRYGVGVGVINDFDGPVLACDIPTGVDGRTGAVPGVAVRADMTLTLGAHKLGLWLHPAAALVGDLRLGDIGVDDGHDAPVAHVLQPADLRAISPPPGPRDHKRTRGIIVVYAGSDRMAGAAILCARAALRAGAGLVTVATPEAAASRIAGAVPEAMTIPLPDDADGIVEAVSAALGGAHVLAVGPGLGLADHTQEAVRRLVTGADLHVVLDADGLNAFRDHTDALEEARHGSTTELVLTPHAKEMGRLAGVSGHAVQARRTEVAVEQAIRFRATVVAKGPRTVVAGPDGDLWVTPTGGPGLATGGTGDVLTGVTATLLAQRPEPRSVAAAAYLHGLAGDLSAAACSARASTAGTVVDHLADAARELGL